MSWDKDTNDGDNSNANQSAMRIQERSSNVLGSNLIEERSAEKEEEDEEPDEIELLKQQVGIQTSKQKEVDNIDIVCSSSEEGDVDGEGHESHHHEEEGTVESDLEIGNELKIFQRIDRKHAEK